MDKTVELKLIDLEVARIRRSRRYCEHCETAFYTDDNSQVVCNECVQAAMVAEGFLHP